MAHEPTLAQAPDDTGAALLALGTATLGESGARVMRGRVAAVWSGARVAAPAYPVQCTPGDNLAVHVAVAHAPAGVALAVNVGDERELGYWGEVLTTAAEARRVAGLVIDGCVRDVTALEAHGFPVFATGLALRGATKTRPGSAGRSTRVGDVDVEPGDWVVGDADGVVVVPGGAIRDVLVAARARADREAAYFAALRDGATTVDLLSLDASLVDRA